MPASRCRSVRAVAPSCCARPDGAAARAPPPPPARVWRCTAVPRAERPTPGAGAGTAARPAPGWSCGGRRWPAGHSRAGAENPGRPGRRRQWAGSGPRCVEGQRACCIRGPGWRPGGAPGARGSRRGHGGHRCRHRRQGAAPWQGARRDGLRCPCALSGLSPGRRGCVPARPAGCRSSRAGIPSPSWRSRPLRAG